MKALGIIRKVDELGRLVIPKEYRKANGWEPGTAVEMFATNEGLTIRKYKTDLEKQNLLNDLYDVFHNTENDAAYEIIGRAIDFVKKA